MQILNLFNLSRFYRFHPSPLINQILTDHQFHSGDVGTANYIFEEAWKTAREDISILLWWTECHARCDDHTSDGSDKSVREPSLHALLNI